MSRKATPADNPHQGHRERLKQRCLEEGLDSFSDHQVLELLLFYSLPYQDTNGLAHRLLDAFGSFSAVLNADYSELLRVDGVGPNTAVLLSLMPDLLRRFQLDQFGPRPDLSTLERAGEFCCGLFLDKSYEAFYLICLDLNGNLNKAALLSEGSISNVPVYPRLAVETALRHRAAAVILTHNHPGGTLRPSHDDLTLTDAVTRALSTISVDVLDHIIVARGKYYSMAQKGLIKGKLS
ncbi:MAG: DNA repair protein RadC [Firmicutes bacterium]|nr:DNA repair protein RadC [Bacillota bacterium]